MRRSGPVDVKRPGGRKPARGLVMKLLFLMDAAAAADRCLSYK